MINRLSKKAWLEFLWIVLLVSALDQLTKFAILNSFEYGDQKEIIPGVFNLILTFNKGAAFGLLSGVGDGFRELILGITTLAALFVVFYFLIFEYNQDRVGQLALSMIVGGALGNVIDRMRLGMVVDFLDFYYKDYHWPAFNVADSSICIGVFLLILRSPGREKNL